MMSQFQDEKLCKVDADVWCEASLLTGNNHYGCKIKHTVTENTQQHNAINNLWNT